jgi:signal transduction histidine kinase
VSIAREPWPLGLRAVVLAPRQLAWLAYVLIGLAFIVDMATPQALNAEVFYAVPVVLAAFSPSRKLTYRLILVAILADELGAIGDAALDGFRWDVIGIENRFLSLVTLATVAALTLAVQGAAARLGSLSAIDVQRRRHAALSSAADHILATLGSPQLDAAIASEAARVLEQATVFWCPGAAGGDCWRVDGGVARKASLADMPAKLAAFAQPPPDARQAELRPTRRLVRSERGAGPSQESVLIVPIADRGALKGVLLAPVADPDHEPGLLVIAESFANLVVGALQQSNLISDLAARNRALGEKQGVIQGLIDAIAHDLRTPLKALSVTLQQAVEGAYGDLPAEYAAVLGESKTSIDEISRLAETLLLVARLESGGRRVVRARVRLDALVRELASEFGAMAAARGVEIVTHSPESVLTQGAGGDLRRAIANLVANAIAHTPRGGKVKLRVTSAAGSVEVSVADDGYGIDELERENLFERFSPVAQSGTGTGLGLYIVRRVAEEMGGGVRYEPRRPRGSTFTLTLPGAA